MAAAPLGHTLRQIAAAFVARVRAGQVGHRVVLLHFGLGPDALEDLLVHRVLAHGGLGLVAGVASHRFDHVGRDHFLESGRFRAIALSIARLVGSLGVSAGGCNALVRRRFLLAAHLIGLLLGGGVLVVIVQVGAETLLLRTLGVDPVGGCITMVGNHLLIL